METTVEKLTDRIKRILQEREWGQQYLGTKIGMGQPAISRRLKGTIEMDRSFVQKVADAFEITLEAFVKGTDKEGLLQTPEVIKSTLDELTEALSEERAENSRLQIDLNGEREAKRLLTEELNTRPKKEDFAELGSKLAELESQAVDLVKRLKNEETSHENVRKAKQAEETAHEAERKRRQATEKSWQEVVNRELALQAERHNLRNELQAANRDKAQLELEKGQLTAKLARSYDKIDRLRQAFAQAQQDVEQAKKDGRSSNTWGILLGAGAGALLAANAATSKKKR